MSERSELFDWSTGQPQEREYSDAGGGTRDRLPPARGTNRAFATMEAASIASYPMAIRNDQELCVAVANASGRDGARRRPRRWSRRLARRPCGPLEWPRGTLGRPQSRSILARRSLVERLWRRPLLAIDPCRMDLDLQLLPRLINTLACSSDCCCLRSSATCVLRKLACQLRLPRISSGHALSRSLLYHVPPHLPARFVSQERHRLRHLMLARLSRHP